MERLWTTVLIHETGQDSTEAGCTINDNNNILTGDVDDHRGPYNGIVLSHKTCNAFDDYLDF